MRSVTARRNMSSAFMVDSPQRVWSRGRCLVKARSWIIVPARVTPPSAPSRRPRRWIVFKTVSIAHYASSRTARVIHLPLTDEPAATTPQPTRTLVDGHVHVALDMFEPVEMLLTQMQYNGVDHALILPNRIAMDHSYLIECLR